MKTIESFKLKRASLPTRGNLHTLFTLDITCFLCNEKGHYSHRWTKEKIQSLMDDDDSDKEVFKDENLSLMVNDKEEVVVKDDKELIFLCPLSKHDLNPKSSDFKLTSLCLKVKSQSLECKIIIVNLLFH